MKLPNPDSQIITTLEATDIINDYNQIGVDVSSYFKGIKNISLFLDHQTGLMQWHPSIVGDGDFYSRLSNVTMSYYPQKKNEYQIAYSCLANNSKVLEIGCGKGHFAPFVGQDYWYGVDINSEAIDVCKSNGFRSQVWNLFDDKIENLNAQISDFDAICSFQTLEHFAHPELFFRRLSKMMNESQKLLIAVPSHNSILGLNPYTTLNLPPHHQTLWSDYALHQLPRNNGFKCTDLIHCDVDPAHKQWFFQELLRSLLLQKDFSRVKFINSITRKVLNRLIHYLSQHAISDQTSFDNRFGLRGQSVIGVYSKIP